MGVKSDNYSPVRGWVPDESVGGPYIPAEIQYEMKNGSYKPSRSTEWTVNELSGVPWKFTLVSPFGKTVKRGSLKRWAAATDRIVEEIFVMCGDKRIPPCSIDITLYLGDHKKELFQRCVEPVNANTGYMSKNTATGSVDIMIYRKEEALKTLAHELLHAFGFSDWANRDHEVQRRCHEWAMRIGVNIADNMKPTEAMVDALAIWLVAKLYASEQLPSCVRYSETKAADLLLFMGGRWKQKTAAFEYYCVKAALLKKMDQLLDCHGAGLQRPDKSKVRKVFASMGSIGGASAPKAKRVGMNMRMTPARFPSVPPVPSSRT